MIAIGKWQPKRSLNYPSDIPLWVRVLGVPKEFRTVQAFESIGDAIGRVIEVDLDEMRVLVVVDAFKELCFETSVDFKGGEYYDGEEVPILLRYEKLFGYCKSCGSLCHQEAKCPLMKVFKQQPERKMESREGNGGWHEGNKHDDRARSYKGVLINWNGGQQNRERDTREYYGKGKGKMVEENDSKWVRVSDRSTRKPSGNKGSNRGNVEETRTRSGRRDDTNMIEQEGKKVSSSRQLSWAQEEAKEEGEIREEGVTNMLPPSQGFQEQLANTQAVGTEVVSDPIDTEKGLKQLQGLVEGQLKIGENEVMEWEDLESADDLPDLTEEELVAMNLELEEQASLEEIKEPSGNEEVKEQQMEEDAMKQATKKAFHVYYQHSSEFKDAHC